MRLQRTVLAAIALAALAAGALAGAGPAGAALVTSCTGTAADVTVPGDLFVPAGESCELTNVTITGNTTVRAGADLLLTDSTLAGTLTVQGDGFADLDHTTVAGASRLAGAFGLFSADSTLTGNLTATDSGFAYGLRTSYGGSVRSTNGETFVESSRIARNLATTGDNLTDLADTVVAGTVTVADTELGSVVCSSEIDGDASFSGATAAGVVQVGAEAPDSNCAFNVFGAGLTLTGNRAPITINGNVVRGVLACTDNDPAPTGSGNRLRGGGTGQCADLGAPTATTAAARAGRGKAVLGKVTSRRAAGGRAAAAAGPAQIRR
jgi:hypothetical protein